MNNKAHVEVKWRSALDSDHSEHFKVNLMGITIDDKRLVAQQERVDMRKESSNIAAMSI